MGALLFDADCLWAQ